MFKYDWSKFNARMGLIFMAGVIVVFSLMGKFEFEVLSAGIAALIAWIPIIMVPTASWRQHAGGLLVYLIVGTALTWLAAMLAPYQWALLSSMAVVTFAGYMVMLRGLHPFLVAWCLVYWYLLAPVFLSGKETGSVVLGFATGAGLVLALNLIKPVWMRATGDATNQAVEAAEPDQEKPPLGFVIRFSVVVSVSIMAGLAAGMRWLTHDPTLVANATLNMISPTLKQTWMIGMERLILGTLGLLAGFYFGWYFPDPWVGNVVTAVTAFLALAVLYVNMQFLTGILFFMIAYSWGTMRSDLAHEIGNEKLIGEFVGVGIAIVAIAILASFERWRSSVNS